jgi:hypothetical protein
VHLYQPLYELPNWIIEGQIAEDKKSDAAQILYPQVINMTFSIDSVLGAVIMRHLLPAPPGHGAFLRADGFLFSAQLNYRMLDTRQTVCRVQRFDDDLWLFSTRSSRPTSITRNARTITPATASAIM